MAYSHRTLPIETKERSCIYFLNESFVNTVPYDLAIRSSWSIGGALKVKKDLNN